MLVCRPVWTGCPMKSSPIFSPPDESRPPLNRRAFLQRTLAAGALAVSPAFGPTLSRGETAPSNRVTIGLIGKGLMGAGHLERITNDPAFQTLAICDVDRVRRDSGKEKIEAIYA